MAGLIQATAHWLLTERPFKPQEQDYLLYKFNRFQACRYGLEGVLTDAYTMTAVAWQMIRCVCWTTLPPLRASWRRQRH